MKLSSAGKWMEPETVIKLHEISQIQEDKYCLVLTFLILL
jgi:hypothetical protein